MRYPLQLMLVACACAGGTVDAGVPHTDAVDSDDAGSGSTCFGDESVPCSDCLADACCETFGPCMADDDCYNAYSCLLRCGDALEDCVAGCAAGGNAAWQAMAACGGDACGTASCAAE